MMASKHLKLNFRTSFAFCILAIVCSHPEENADIVEKPVPSDHHPNDVHEHTSLFNKDNIRLSPDHIMAHLEGVINKPVSEMNQEELQFHYFKLHDYDNNSKLDGLEIINAMTHYHKDSDSEPDSNPRQTDAELMTVIDDIMKDEDLNDNGYIEYLEFVKLQGRFNGKEVDENDGKDTDEQGTLEEGPVVQEADPAVLV